MAVIRLDELFGPWGMTASRHSAFACRISNGDQQQVDAIEGPIRNRGLDNDPILLCFFTILFLVIEL